MLKRPKIRPIWLSTLSNCPLSTVSLSLPFNLDSVKSGRLYSDSERVCRRMREYETGKFGFYIVGGRDMHHTRGVFPIDLEAPCTQGIISGKVDVIEPVAEAF